MHHLQELKLCLPVLYCLIVNLTLATIKICSIKHNAELDNTSTQSWLFWEMTLRASASKMDCAQLCFQQNSCISFMFNKRSRICRMFGARITKYNKLVTDLGFLSYDTCRANNAFGNLCTRDADCLMLNSECIDQTCQCQYGWSYSPKDLLCVRECAQYGDMFTGFKDIPIRGTGLLSLKATKYLSPDGCSSACVATTQFLCRSFYLDLRSKTCRPQEMTPYMLSSLGLLLNLFSSNADYYQRHCQYTDN